MLLGKLLIRVVEVADPLGKLLDGVTKRLMGMSVVIMPLPPTLLFNIPV